MSSIVIDWTIHFRKSVYTDCDLCHDEPGEGSGHVHI